MNRHLARVVTVAMGLSLAGALTGCGSSAKADAGATVPGALRSVYAVPYVKGAILTWKAPTKNGGSPITGYVVTPYKAGVAKSPITFNGTKTRRIVTPLPNGKSYRFGVAARNAVGTGPMSPLSAAIVIGTPGQPGKPEIEKNLPPGVTVPPPGPGELYLRSRLPARNSARIERQDWKCTSSNGGVTRKGVVKASVGRFTVVSDLTVGKKYRCTTTATNKYGTGRRSVPSNAVVA
jgi:large repetitive protein